MTFECAWCRGFTGDEAQLKSHFKECKKRISIDEDGGISIEAIRIKSTADGGVEVDVLVKKQWIEVFLQSARDFLPEEGMVSQVIESLGIARRYEEQKQ